MQARKRLRAFDHSVAQRLDVSRIPTLEQKQSNDLLRRDGGVFGEDQPLNALVVGGVALMRDEMFRRRVEVKLNEAVVLAIELDFVARIVLQLDRVIAVDQVRGVDEA